MSRKTITISDEAYARLKRRKKEGESFTDVILRGLAENERRASKSITRTFE